MLDWFLYLFRDISLKNIYIKKDHKKIRLYSHKNKIIDLKDLTKYIISKKYKKCEIESSINSFCWEIEGRADVYKITYKGTTDHIYLPTDSLKNVESLIKYFEELDLRLLKFDQDLEKETIKLDLSEFTHDSNIIINSDNYKLNQIEERLDKIEGKNANNNEKKKKCNKSLY